jgi:hypothetical protein
MRCKTLLVRGTAWAAERIDEVTKTEHSISRSSNGRPLWTISHDANEGKPYIHPLATSNGKVLSELRPDDHPWHRALWFSWKFIRLMKMAPIVSIGRLSSALDRTPIPGEPGGKDWGGYAGYSLGMNRDVAGGTFRNSEGQTGGATHRQPALWPGLLELACWNGLSGSPEGGRLCWHGSSPAYREFNAWSGTWRFRIRRTSAIPSGCWWELWWEGTIFSEVAPSR